MGRKNRKSPVGPPGVPPATSRTEESATSVNGPQRWRIWLLVGLVVLSSALIRGRLLSCPLERDEGEYAYAGQLILQGVPPYELAYNMKLPGTYAAYAVLMAMFGQKTEGVHAGLILINGVTILLVFLLGCRLFDAVAGLAASAAYALLSLAPNVLGLAAHATHFVDVFAVAGALAVWWACHSERRLALFLSGMLMGIAFLMKQHAIFFVGFGGSILLWQDWQVRRVNFRIRATRAFIYLIGALAPFIITVAILAWCGVLDRCLFWTFAYASNYVSQVPLSVALELVCDSHSQG